MNAVEILNEAAETIGARAAERDTPQERSMRRAADAFNKLTGHCLSERDGWLFMAVLKMARATAGKHKLDDYLDGAAYFALAGESAEPTDADLLARVTAGDQDDAIAARNELHQRHQRRGQEQ